MVDAINEESAFAVYKITNPVVGNQHSSPKKKKKKQKMNNKALKHDKQNNKKISHVLKSIDPVELLAQGKPIMKDKKVNGVDKKKSNKSRKEKLKPLLNGDSDVPILQKINSSKSFELNLPKTTKSKTAKKQKSNKEIPIVDDSEEYEFVTTDSYEEGKDLFSWLIAPYSADDFFKSIWEKKPLHIKREEKNYYKGIISTPIIDALLRTEEILFTKNLDITSYVNNQRETHNPIGRALPHVVWDYYLNGCSVRLLNPQTYIPKLHLLNASLQEYFHCFVGANSYLTPPNSQGFAPHYDDIEAFILQVEGKKLWKIYSPISEEEVLPRVSSKNFSQDEIGEPLMEIILEPGDLLYFPRGFIHQGVTTGDDHSLHVTVSCYQKQSWADLFEKMLPQALESATRLETELREGVPLDISQHLGLVHSDSNTPRRKELIGKIKKLFDKVIDHLQFDDAVDQLSKKFVKDALPPVLTEAEKELTVFGNTDRMIEDGEVIDRVEIQLDTKIRLIRANIIRLVMEEETVRMYYYVGNSKEYHGNELQYLEVDEHLAPGIETLITSYPDYVSVENLDVPLDSDKLQIATDLWEKGIVMTETPLDFIE